MGAAGSAWGQAPQIADLWRVPTATLAVPPALEGGPTGRFWNPAAGDDGKLAVGIRVAQTSDIVGLSGLLAGVSYSNGGIARIGLEFGRVEVRDLVRTTSSPNSQLGTIPVYEQLLGVSAQLARGPVQFGASLRLHDSRFDAIAEQGITLDMGVQVFPTSTLRLAAATHFLPLDLDDRMATDYYAGAEYVAASHLPLAGTHASLLARYGATYRASGDLEHGFGVGLTVNDRFGLDAALMGESAYGIRSWRSALGIDLQVGRYTIGIGRSAGLNDLGATYRVGLDVEVTR
jgi:hypothetical protein